MRLHQGASPTLGPRVVLVSFIFSAFSLLVHAPLAGQEIRGHLLESETGTPIPWGSIALLDSAFVSVAGAITNESGAFLIRAPAPGSYYVLGESLGYEPRLDGILELGTDAAITIEFFLRPKPIQLDSILVALKRHRVFRSLNKVGYYDRLDRGFGTFITPEEIERRNPRTSTDLFRHVPDLKMGGQTIEGTRLYLMRGGVVCNPMVYVDGLPVYNDTHTEQLGPEGPDIVVQPGMTMAQANPQFGVVFEHLVNIEDIAAVEVHTRATSIPLQYGDPQFGCGVILVWTHLEAGEGGAP